MTKINLDTNKFFYINLDFRTDRNRHFLNKIDNIPILRNNIRRFSGIDGKKIDIETLSSNFITEKGKKVVLNNKYNKAGVPDLTYGAVGCALSHYSLYKECVENNYESILIFEDDAYLFADQFEEKLNMIHQLDFNHFDILFLGTYREYNGVISYLNFNEKEKPIVKNYFIEPLKLPLIGCYATFITNRGAKKLIETLFPISIQFDIEMGHKIEEDKIKALRFNENIVYTCTKFTSNIQGLTGLKVE